MSKTEVAVVTAEPVATLVVASNKNATFNAEDFHIPKLNCIQKMSQIEGNPGEIVLDRRAAIIKPGKKLPVTVVSIEKSWTEKTPYDGDDQARVVYTAEEAAQLKLDSKYDVIPRAEIIMLIPHVADLSGLDEEEAAEMFPYLVDGTGYQLARLIVQSFAYDHTFKILNSFHSGNPQLALVDTQWNLSSLLLERGKYSWYVPCLGRSAATTPKAVKTFLINMAGGTAA
jgi:hypothetical protein